MNRNAILSETLFEFAHRETFNGGAVHHEKRRSRNELFDLVEICRVVRRDSHRSIRPKRAVHRREEVLRHETA